MSSCWASPWCTCTHTQRNRHSSGASSLTLLKTRYAAAEACPWRTHTQRDWQWAVESFHSNLPLHYILLCQMLIHLRATLGGWPVHHACMHDACAKRPALCEHRAPGLVRM